MFMGALFTGDSANTKLMAESIQNEYRLNIVIKGIVLYQVIFAVVAVLVLWIGAGAVAALPSSKDSIYSGALALTGVIVLIIVSYLISIMYSSFWTGFQKLNWEMLAYLGPITIQFVIFAGLLPFGFGLNRLLWFWGWGWIFYTLLFLTVFFFLFLKTEGVKLDISSPFWNGFPHRNYLLLGFYFKTSKGVQISIPLIFSFYIGYLLANSSEIGMYGSAARLVGVIPVMIGPLMKALFPNISQLFEQNDLSMLRNISLIIFKYVNFIIFFVASVFLIFSDEIINIVYGSAYREAIPIFIVLTAAAYFEGIKMISIILLNATKYASSVTKIEVFKWVFIIAGTFGAIKSFGVYAGVIVLLTGSIITLIALLFLIKRYLQVNITQLNVGILFMTISFILLSFSFTSTYGTILLIGGLVSLGRGIKMVELKSIYSLFAKPI